MLLCLMRTKVLNVLRFTSGAMPASLLWLGVGMSPATLWIVTHQMYTTPTLGDTLRSGPVGAHQLPLGSILNKLTKQPEQCSSPTPTLTTAQLCRQPWQPLPSGSWQRRLGASGYARGWSLLAAGALGAFQIGIEPNRGLTPAPIHAILHSLPKQNHAIWECPFSFHQW